MATKFKSINDYIAMQEERFVPLLENLRQIIKEEVPDAEERISYNMPAYYYHGMLLGFAAFKNHCSFLPWDGNTTTKFAKELKGFKTSAGAIQFTVENPLPKKLIIKLIQKRVKDNLKKKP